MQLQWHTAVIPNRFHASSDEAVVTVCASDVIAREKRLGVNNEERFRGTFLNVLKLDLGKVANVGALDRAPTTKTCRHAAGLNALDSPKINIGGGENDGQTRKRWSPLTSHQADYVMLRQVT